MACCASFISFICFLNALDADIVSAEQTGTAVGIFIALIFTAHDAALAIWLRFYDIARLVDTISLGGDIVSAVPCRCIGFSVECSEIVDRMTVITAIACASGRSGVTFDGSIALLLAAAVISQCGA